MALAALDTRQAHARADDLRPRLLQLRRPPLPRRQEGRPWHGGHVQVHRRSPATPTTTCSPTTWASTTSPASWAARLRPARPASTSEGESRKACCPRTEWKKQRFKKPEQQKWYAGETISIGIGQGYNAYTPMQLAQATATLANNGVMFRPHLVKLHHRQPEPARSAPVEPQPMRDAAAQAAEHRCHQAARWSASTRKAPARAPSPARAYEAAGKTGTAQVCSAERRRSTRQAAVKKELRDHALFIAFAPADKPKIALAVLVENGGFGAQSAAPIARMVLDYYLLGKLPARRRPRKIRRHAGSGSGADSDE